MQLAGTSPAYPIMAYRVMAYIVMAYIVMAHRVMAYILMAYIVMVYIVKAQRRVSYSHANRFDRYTPAQRTQCND